MSDCGKSRSLLALLRRAEGPQRCPFPGVLQKSDYAALGVVSPQGVLVETRCVLMHNRTMKRRPRLILWGLLGRCRDLRTTDDLGRIRQRWTALPHVGRSGHYGRFLLGMRAAVAPLTGSGHPALFPDPLEDARRCIQPELSLILRPCGPAFGSSFKRPCTSG